MSRRGAVARYVLLPEVLPRLKDIWGSGLGPVALFMAHVFHMVRLLPAGHPYLNAANQGRFGILNVLQEAKTNLVFKKENIDQIIIYYTLFLGFFLVVAQFVLLLFSLSMHFAHASAPPAWYTNIFSTPNPGTDLAFMFLDAVFGVDRVTATGVPLFGSDVSTSGLWGAWPTPMHNGLHSLFAFYSHGLFFVALLIILYYVITVAAETAATGVPFGQRLNKAWVPIRLIFAVFLLFPITNGLNGAQILTLYTAKWGSGLATNGWITFMNGVISPTSSPMGNIDDLIASPTVPRLTGLLEFMFVSHTCAYAYEYLYGTDIKPYIVKSDAAPLEMSGEDFTSALAYTDNQQIVIRFGEQDPAYTMEESQVRPLCGELVMSPVDLNTDGAYAVQEQYFEFIDYLWTFDNLMVNTFAPAIACAFTPTHSRSDGCPGFAAWSTFWPIDPNDINTLIEDYYDSSSTAGMHVTDIVDNAVADQVAAMVAQASDAGWVSSFTSGGWAGAGMWYNQIAEINGSMTAAVKNIPMPVAYPELMEYVRGERQKTSSIASGGEDKFKPILPNGETMAFHEPGEEYIALALYYAQNLWKDKHGSSTGNIFVDTTNVMFEMDGPDILGLGSLFDMLGNSTKHPLAQLTALGSALIHNTIILFAGSGLGVLSEYLLGAAQWNDFKAVAKTAGSMMKSLAMIGVSLGFILYYIVPFLPFIYFFLAVGKWVKTIFEAMVGVPLWALAHIRIDGQGLPGPMAMNGYYLLLEVLIRPVLVVFSFIGAVLIFSAQVSILQEIWSTAVSNVVGFDLKAVVDGTAPATGTGALDKMRGAIDAFFYTILYVIVVYMLALASFKLVDLIPNKILRWIGASVSAFAEGDEDPAGHLVQNTYLGVSTATGQMSGAFAGLVGRN